MTKLFISYARGDMAKVSAVTHELEELGFAVWMDVTRIRGGKNWSAEIVKAITDCDYFLLFISSASIESDSIRRELNLAHKNKKNIIPLMLEKASIPMEWEFQTIGIQWIECSEANWISHLLLALRDNETDLQIASRRQLKAELKVGEKWVQLVVNGAIENFDDTRKEDVKTILAALLKVNKDDIRILRVSASSITLDIAMPEKALTRLFDLAHNNDLSIKRQQISSITFDLDDVVDKDFKLDDSLKTINQSQRTLTINLTTTHFSKSHYHDPLSSLQERLAGLSKRTFIPIACIGGVYLDIVIHNIKLQKNKKHYLDFSREIPIRLETHPGGSIYYVTRYLSELGRKPLLVSHVGDGSKNGFADTFFKKMIKDGLEEIAQNVTRQRDAATAVTIHFVHPDPKQASAMYTDRDVLKNFGWQQAKEILQDRGKTNKQTYDNGVIYIAGFFKTDLYRYLDENLTELQRNGAIIFLDHGRLEPDEGTEGRDQIRSLAESLRLVDVYFTTKEELSQFIREIARDMPERFAKPIRVNDPLPKLVDQVTQDAQISFPPIILIKDRTGEPSVHRLGVRNINGNYDWKDIIVPRSHPISEYSVGSSNAFNAGFIDAFLELGNEINIQTITKSAEKAQLRMINIESGKRIDDESSL